MKKEKKNEPKIKQNNIIDFIRYINIYMITSGF